MAAVNHARPGLAMVSFFADHGEVTNFTVRPASIVDPFLKLEDVRLC